MPLHRRYLPNEKSIESEALSHKVLAVGAATRVQFISAKGDLFAKFLTENIVRFATSGSIYPEQG